MPTEPNTQRSRRRTAPSGACAFARLLCICTGVLLLWRSLATAEVITAALPLRDPPVVAAPAAPDFTPSGIERLPAVSIPAAERIFPVDLCVVLRLADVRNPTIGLAREAIRENLALQQAASVLLLPTLRAGGNYHDHTGNLQRAGGTILSLDEQSLYYGGGARTLAAESVAFPAVQIFSHLGDAYFEPLAARQRTAASQFNAQATANAQLLEVTTFYLRLVAAEANFEIYQQSRLDMDNVVRGTAAFAEIGQGRQADADRAVTEARLLQSQQLAAEERVVVAAARLSGSLNLDPDTRLRAMAGPIPIVELVSKTYSLEQLEDVALRRRPEMAAREALLEMQETRVRQERTRPLLPTLSVGFSGGVFGGGSDLTMPFFGRFNGRDDFDVVAYWSAQNLGFGNLAITANRRAQRDEAWSERLRTRNLILREVADAFARSAAEWRNLAVARDRLGTAEEGFQEDLARIRGGQGLPIELLDSLQRLVSARQAIVAAVTAYDEAQFQLFVALGQPPTIALPCAQSLCERLPQK